MWERRERVRCLRMEQLGVTTFELMHSCRGEGLMNVHEERKDRMAPSLQMVEVVRRVVALQAILIFVAGTPLKIHHRMAKRLGADRMDEAVNH